MRSRNRAFTLLEVLAAVTLLVLLFSMLFQIFGTASEIVEISRARQEVFQYGRASLEFLERELGGAFVGSDGNTTTGNKGMKIYNTWDMNLTKNANADEEDEEEIQKRRTDTQGIFFSTAIMARDTRKERNKAKNPYYGRDVNVARVAYYLNDEKENLDQSALYRSELYVLTEANPEEGGPFVRNCLYFFLDVLDQYSNSANFTAMNWDSDNRPGLGRRPGIPRAIRVRLRVTDEMRAALYKWDEGGEITVKEESKGHPWYIPGLKSGMDYWGQKDPVVRSFSLVVYFGRR